MSIRREINQFTRRLDKQVKGSINNRVLKEIGRLATDIIKKRTRNGFGVAQPGRNARRLKGLSAGYVAFRKASSRLNSGLTTPGKSNLTFTGALLDSLRVVRVDKSRREININANNRRRPGGVTNKDVAEFVTDQGRAFLNLSRRETELVARRFNRSFRQQFKSTVRG